MDREADYTIVCERANKKMRDDDLCKLGFAVNYTQFYTNEINGEENWLSSMWYKYGVIKCCPPKLPPFLCVQECAVVTHMNL